MNTLKIAVIAGEPSGDNHAASLIKEFISDYNVTLFGTGGNKLKSLGQKQLATVDSMAVIGFSGVLQKIPYLVKLSNSLIQEIGEQRPDFILLVDYAGFNLRFAKKVKKKFPDIPVIGLIAPQVWVWRYSRVKILKAYFDKVLCILPFEEKILVDAGVDAKYIGNPVVCDMTPHYKSKEEFCLANNLDSTKLIVGLIPGSRRKEVIMLLPMMMYASSVVENAQFVIAQAESTDDRLISDINTEGHIIIKGKSIDVMKYADILWICSGTATLEAAILKTPMIILYQSEWINFFIAQHLTTLRMVGLPNIIANKMGYSIGPVVPELLSKDCNGKNLVATHNSMLNNLDSFREKLQPVSDLFSDAEPMRNAKNEIIQLLNLS